jgi:hypothetical protein
MRQEAVVMLVGGVRSPTLDANVGSRRRTATSGASGAAGASATSARAVIALAPIEETSSAGIWTRRPSAPFLAHLIATDQHAPQTRERRRAEPAEAVSAYAAAGAPVPLPGRVLARSM